MVKHWQNLVNHGKISTDHGPITGKHKTYIGCSDEPVGFQNFKFTSGQNLTAGESDRQKLLNWRSPETPRGPPHQRPRTSVRPTLRKAHINSQKGNRE